MAPKKCQREANEKNVKITNQKKEALNDPPRILCAAGSL
jgi:hypothetical protein